VSYSLPMARKVKARSGAGPSGARESKTRVSSKHQVTIPAAEFRGAGLREGDTLQVKAEGAGRVVLTRVDELLDRYSGSLESGGELRRTVDALRDEWR
jgi:bifunctional DNA-binding transcriptional regulator/antitoxin component of YhaV-PrlF toxin-antitoxin module